MKDINYMFEDIDEINFNIDVGIKEIFPPLENLEVTPTKEVQKFTHENSYGYDEVIVETIPDEYIIPSGTLSISQNGDVDVTNFKMAKVEVYIPPILQDKTITPTKEIQNITSDENYDGLRKVIVNPIPDEYVIPKLETKSISVNGTYNASDDNLDGYSSVEVSVEGKDEELEASYTSLIDGTKGENCTKLPDDLTTIGEKVFYNFQNIGLTELPNSVTSIEKNAFWMCVNMRLKKLPDNLTSIGENAFYGCTSLEFTRLPESLTTIEDAAFDNSNISITHLPFNIRSISSSCFRNTPLTELTVNGAITYIYSLAFMNCSNLTKIVLPNITGVPRLMNKNAFSNTPIESGTGYIYVPDNLVDRFKTASNWSTYADQIKPISEMEVT